MTIAERNEMVMDNIKLVTMVTKKMYCDPRAYYDKEDMWQVGVLGLIKAVQYFDPDKGFKFSTYAVPMIQGEIRRFCRDNFNQLRYTRAEIDAYAKIQQYGKDLEELTAEDLDNLGITPNQMAAVLSMTTRSLDYRIEGTKDSSTELSDLVADPNSRTDLSDESQLAEIEEFKNAILANYSESHRDLIDEWYYTTSLEVAVNQAYLGRKYRFSQAQVSRIIRKFKKEFKSILSRAGYDLPVCFSS